MTGGKIVMMYTKVSRLLSIEYFGWKLKLLLQSLYKNIWTPYLHDEGPICTYPHCANRLKPQKRELLRVM